MLTPERRTAIWREAIEVHKAVCFSLETWQMLMQQVGPVPDELEDEVRKIIGEYSYEIPNDSQPPETGTPHDHHAGGAGCPDVEGRLG